MPPIVKALERPAPLVKALERPAPLVKALERPAPLVKALERPAPLVWIIYSCRTVQLYILLLIRPMLQESTTVHLLYTCH